MASKIREAAKECGNQSSSVSKWVSDQPKKPIDMGSDAYLTLGAMYEIGEMLLLALAEISEKLDKK